MSLLDICQAIENSSIGTAMRESNYYWMLNGSHVLGIAISAGAIFWFDLRAMGFGSADYVHAFTEAKKLAFEDRRLAEMATDGPAERKKRSAQEGLV